MISRTYLRESAFWIVTLMATVVGAVWLTRHTPVGSGWRLFAIAVVAVVTCGGLWVELRQVARMDELHRHMYLVATLSGSMLAMLFCVVAYLGEVLALWSRVSPIYALAVMGVGFLFGWAGARRRYA